MRFSNLFPVQGDTESHSGGSEKNKKMVPEVMTEINERTSTLDILEVAVSLTGVFKCLLNLNTSFNLPGKQMNINLSLFPVLCLTSKQSTLSASNG